jgi:hypothetical protein
VRGGHRCWSLDTLVRAKLLTPAPMSLYRWLLLFSPSLSLFLFIVAKCHLCKCTSQWQEVYFQ